MPIPSLRHFGIFAVVGLTLVGCSKKPVEPAPAPAGAPSGRTGPATDKAATYEQVMTDVDAGEESYMKMAIAAAGYLRHLVPGKVIGFYQDDLKGPRFRDMVEEVTKTYAYRPIRPSDFHMVCVTPTNNPNSGTVTTAGQICSMYLVDVVAQFEVTRMTLDSGWVGGATTQVPRGSTYPEEKPFCITLARDGNNWKPIRTIPIDDRRRCPR